MNRTFLRPWIAASPRHDFSCPLTLKTVTVGTLFFFLAAVHWASATHIFFFLKFRTHTIQFGRLNNCSFLPLGIKSPEFRNILCAQILMFHSSLLGALGHARRWRGGNAESSLLPRTVVTWDQKHAVT